MQIQFAQAANDELNDACDWFNQQQVGLGDRFRYDVRDAVLLISKAPLLFPVELEDVRRYVMNRFSYTLRYVVRGEVIWILAVSHQHRRPDYWVDRTQE
jgi:plasmid stabilization system protein ParE